MYALTAECTYWLPNVRIDCRMYLVVYILLMYALFQNVCIDCRMYLAHVRPFCWMYLWDVLLYFIRPVFAKHWIYPLFGIAVSLIYRQFVRPASRCAGCTSARVCIAKGLALRARWTAYASRLSGCGSHLCGEQILLLIHCLILAKFYLLAYV